MDWEKLKTAIDCAMQFDNGLVHYEQSAQEPDGIDLYVSVRHRRPMLTAEVRRFGGLLDTEMTTAAQQWVVKYLDQEDTQSGERSASNGL
jgi:hypothetical protein